MCFSAEASFGASVILGTVGVITVRQVQTKSQLPFAIIPFIFSFQQFTEGVLWMTFHNNNLAFLQPIATYTFLIFAQIVWPTWVPLSIILLEKDVRRKKILYVILGLGILCSVYITYSFLFYNVHSEISNHHIQYTFDYPHTAHFLWLTGLFYFIPTVVSTFISSVKRMQILGIIILLSCLITRTLMQQHFISVWCFFAALISVIVLFIIFRLQKSTDELDTLTPLSSTFQR
jgi:hypothetical protein